MALPLLGFAGAHFGARIAASRPMCDSKVLQAPGRHGGLQRWRLLNLGRFIMKKIILAPTLAAVAVLTVHIQPVAACGITNGVADGHSVLMFAPHPGKGCTTGRSQGDRGEAEDATCLAEANPATMRAR
jgi:hypothetical protein